MNKWLLCLVAFITLLTACNSDLPQGCLTSGEMEDVLVEWHSAMALANQTTGDRNYQRNVYMDAILKKHGLTQAELDSSLLYYYSHADEFDLIYKRVAQRLEERAVELGASESEIARYASLSQTGDTANVYAGRTTFCLMGISPLNRYDYAAKADTTYKPGDSFLLNFNCDMLCQNGGAFGTAYMSITCEGDTTISRYQRFSGGSSTQLRIDVGDSLKMKKLSLFFYLPTNLDQAASPTLMFVKDVQLVRFHHKEREPMPIEENKPLVEPIAEPLQTPDERIDR